MNAPEYTDLQLMQRVWDVEAVKKLAAKRAYYIANDWREKELSELWVTGEDAKKTASFGRNWGYYIGMDAIRDYYVTAHNETLDALPGKQRGDGCLFEEMCGAACETEAQRQAALSEMTARFLPEGVAVSEALSGRVIYDAVPAR